MPSAMRPSVDISNILLHVKKATKVHPFKRRLVDGILLSCQFCSMLKWHCQPHNLNSVCNEICFFQIEKLYSFGHIKILWPLREMQRAYLFSWKHFISSHCYRGGGGSECVAVIYGGPLDDACVYTRGRL